MARRGAKRPGKAAARGNATGRAVRTTSPPPVVARSLEAMLDDAVSALRGLLSELLEQRLGAVARDLAEVRRALVGGATAAQAAELLDDALERLGALRFTAEPLDAVDPLIHTVVEERRAAGVPAGVIVEAVQPGFRSGRGLVLCKAAVAVSGG